MPDGLGGHVNDVRRNPFTTDVGFKDQVERPDPDLVAMVQFRARNPDAIDGEPVGAFRVFDGPEIPLAAEHGVVLGNLGIKQLDGIAILAPDRGDDTSKWKRPIQLGALINGEPCVHGLLLAPIIGHNRAAGKLDYRSVVLPSLHPLVTR